MKTKILLYTLAAIILTTIQLAEAQQAGKVWRIGFLGGGSLASSAPLSEAFRQGLRELGYVEGKNIIIE